MQLYPNDVVFPEPHVCLRLELAAAGKWPESGPASPDDTRVASAMLKVYPLLHPSVCRLQNLRATFALLYAFKFFRAAFSLSAVMIFRHWSTVAKQSEKTFSVGVGADLILAFQRHLRP